MAPVTQPPLDRPAEPFDREAALRHRLNSFLVQVLGLPENDYYASFDARGILALKALLSDINNILTLKVTIALVEWLARRFNLPGDVESRLRADVLRTKPNTNGFDLWLGYPVALVAEVKCNVPINGGKIYGSAQRLGIERDVQALMKGKRKAAIESRECLKFMAFLDTPEIRQANEHLSRTSTVFRQHVVFDEVVAEELIPDLVYGIYLSASPS